jgi:hypothetical protein
MQEVHPLDAFENFGQDGCAAVNIIEATVAGKYLCCAKYCNAKQECLCEIRNVSRGAHSPSGGAGHMPRI